MRFFALAVAFMACGAATAFYLPGVAPTEYETGSIVEVKAVKMTSVKRQLPYQYYFLPFCRPEVLTNTRENLGEVLRGDRITNTPYLLQMNKNVSCQLVCRHEEGIAMKYSRKQVAKFEKFIRQEYFIHWLMDNLPAATKLIFDNGKEKYQHGFPLGFVNKQDSKDKGDAHLFNHLTLIGKIHPTGEPDKYRVVGFEVRVGSIDVEHYESTDKGLGCKISKPKGPSFVTLNAKKMESGERKEIVWSYSVKWEESEVEWASRWDTYLSSDNEEIHWFAIINSMVTILFLSAIFAFVMIRILRRDFAKYNEEDKEEAIEQTGWKLVHGDVFRPPINSFWLCVFVGTGTQLVCMSMATIVFSMAGMLNPAIRGSLTNAAFALFVSSGVIGGYFGGRLYKTTKGQNWKRAAGATAAMFPLIVFGVGFLLNFFVWYQESSGAIPFTTMVALVLIWQCVSWPIILVGYYFGYRKEAYESPCEPNQIPRQVPEQVWYLSTLSCVLLGGILPFGAVFLELFFILSAMWENQFYYLFGFLFLVFLILFTACSEIAIVMTYLQLCSEDYHWWWRSFFVSGGCSVYVFLYAVFYFATKLQIEDFTSGLLYFGYTSIVVFGFWLLTGTVGFFSTYWFVTVIYRSIKID